MRLIDADALIRDIEHYNLSDGKFQHWVEIQPTIEPFPQWIPCSERLPEEKKEVLISADGDLYIAEYEIDHGKGYWNEVIEYGYVMGVDAWMPLPKPYKENNDQ